MKKIINNPDQFVDEMVEGILLAHPDQVKTPGDDRRVLVRADSPAPGRVGIVTGGGSGHLPLFKGYVGRGLCSGVAIGNVFSSPSVQQCADAAKAVDGGAGVLFLYGNYGGDKMNFDMACEMVDMDDIKTKTVLVCDDVASSAKETAAKRRGVAGMVYAFKVAGAAADKMMSLDEVASVAEKALANIRTMGVALSPCIVPEVGKPTFSINDDEIEVGMGIHGEPGIEVRKMMTADEVAKVILDKIIADMPLASGDKVSVMVNGLGATPLEEQLIVYRSVAKMLAAKNVSVFMPHIGEFATSMEMAGLSITVFKLDSQLEELLRAPASTPFYTSENK